MQRVKAKKSLGQHFLKDLSIAQQISESLALSEPMRVLEVGPGMGVLTSFLLQNPNISLTAVEIDSESVVYLKQHLPELNLIQADFLHLDLNMIYPDGDFCVIGNYPYNISSQIFFKVLQYRDRIPRCSGMIQREVALRLAAKPGKKDYGILSVLLQVWYDVEYLFTVGPEVFAPPPKVQSAVVRLTRNTRTSLQCDEQLLQKVVKTAFNQRRKQLRNALQSLIAKDNPVMQQDVFNLRAEQLSVEQFISLTNLIAENLCQS